MIFGYVMASKAWCKVGLARSLAAIGLVLAADVLVGVTVSALLGTWAGWGKK